MRNAGCCYCCADRRDHQHAIRSSSRSRRLFGSFLLQPAGVPPLPQHTPRQRHVGLSLWLVGVVLLWLIILLQHKNPGAQAQQQQPPATTSIITGGEWLGRRGSTPRRSSGTSSTSSSSGLARLLIRPTLLRRQRDPRPSRGSNDSFGVVSVTSSSSSSTSSKTMRNQTRNHGIAGIEPVLLVRGGSDDNSSTAETSTSNINNNHNNNHNPERVFWDCLPTGTRRIRHWQERGLVLWTIPVAACVLSFATFPYMSRGLYQAMQWASEHTWIPQNQEQVDLQTNVVVRCVVFVLEVFPLFWAGVILTYTVV